MPTIQIDGVGPVVFPDDMSQAEIVQAIERDILPQQRRQQPQVAPTERGGSGGIIGSTVGSLVSGGGGLLSGVGALGGMVLPGVGFDNVLTRAGRSVQEYGESFMSEELRAKRQALSEAIKQAESEGLVAEARAALSTLFSNPSLLASMAIEQIPQFVASGGVGRVAMGVASTAARRGATALGTEAAEVAAREAGRRAALGTAIGTGAGLQAGDVANQAYQDVMNLPDATLANSPAYRELLTTMDPRQARVTLAERAGTEAGVMGGAISAGTMAVLPGAEKLMFGKELSRRAVTRILGGVAGEAAQEAIEEGGGQLAQNIAVSRAGVERDLLSGVGGAAAVGGTLGGIIGGGVAGLRGGPREAPADRESLPLGLRQAINEYVANREPVAGELLIPGREATIETPIGEMTRTQFVRVMEQRLPDMMEADPTLASRISYAQNEDERVRVFQDALQQNRDLIIQGRQQREVSRFEQEEAAAETRAKIAQAEQQISVFNDALASAEVRRDEIQSAPRVDNVALRAVQDEIQQINAAIAGRQSIVEDLTASLSRTEEQAPSSAREVAPKTEQELAREAFEIARARQERSRQRVEAPGLEIPSGARVPDTIPAQREDLRAGAPEITEQRYVLNPEYQNGRLVGGEEVVQIGEADNFGNVLAYVQRRRGDIVETVPVETTMDKLAAIPVRETARMTQDVSSQLAAPPRGVDVEGQTFEPRRAIDRTGGPEMSARAATVEAVQGKPTTVSLDDARRAKRVAAQDKLNKLYLNKLKEGGQSGRLLRNALVNALKDNTLNADQVYAAFIAADVLGPLIPAKANHRIQFVSRIFAGQDAEQTLAASGGVQDQEVQGFRIRPDQPGLMGLIQISLSPTQSRLLRESTAHEAFHVLQDYFAKYDPKFAEAMRTGFKPTMNIKDVDPSIRRKLQSIKSPTSNRSYWDELTASLPNDVSGREAQAYVFASLYDAKKRGVPMTGLKPAMTRFMNMISNFFSRFGKALRGNGYKNVADIFESVTPERVKQFAEREAPTQQDFGRGQLTEFAARQGALLTDGRGLAPTDERTIEFSARQANMSVPEFKTWWEGGWRGEGYTPKQSVARSQSGQPIEFYHGTQKGFPRFGKARSGSYGQEGPFFFSPQPEFSNQYAEQALYAGATDRYGVKSGQRILPVFLSVQNPFDTTTPENQERLINYVDNGLDNENLTWKDLLSKDLVELYQDQLDKKVKTEREVNKTAYGIFKQFLQSRTDNWQSIESRAVQKFLREGGYDGFFLMENMIKNIAVFDPRQIKSVFNKFEQGAATAPEFAARRTTLSQDPNYQMYTEALTSEGIPKSGLFSGVFRRLVGAMESTALYGTPDTPEKLRDALVRTSVNRAYPIWLLQRLADRMGVLNGRDIGIAAETALMNTGRMQMLTELGMITVDPVTGDLAVRDDIKPLLEILRNKIDSKNQSYFQTYAIALRERDLRASGKTGMKTFNGQPFTNQDIDYIINTAEQQNPEFKDVAADLKKFSDGLLDFAVDSGIMTRAKAQELALMFYTPFYRLMEEDAKSDPGSTIGPQMAGGLRNVTSALDKSIKGGDGRIGDLIENILKNADSILRAGLKNNAIRMTAEVARDVGLGKVVRSKGPNVVTYRVNGNEVNFLVEDPVLFTAMATAPAKTRGAIYNAMARMTGFFRDMITMAPSFIWASLYRGKIQAYAQEGASLSPFTTIRGYRDALNGSTSFKSFTAQTGFGGMTYGMGERDFAKKIKSVLDDRGIFRELARGNAFDPFKRAFNFLSRMSEGAELAERLALYEKLKKAGVSDRQAAFQAYNLAPFSRRGSGDGAFGGIVQTLIPLVPFLNAKIQGLYRLVENEKGAPTIFKIPQQIFLRSLMVTAFSTAIYALNVLGDHDEELKGLTVDEIMRYDTIFLGDGKRIVLPRNYEIGSFFGAIPILALEAYRRDNKDDLVKAALSIGTSTLFFNPIPQAALPLISATTNYDFFRNLELENAAIRSRPPEERVDRATTQLAKWASMATGDTVSPIRMQAVLSGYTGSIGTGLMAGLDTILASAGLMPTKPSGAFGPADSIPAIAAGLSGLGRFYRTEETSPTRFVGDFYKVKELSDQLNNSIRDARVMGDFEKIMERQMEKGPLITMRPIINRAATQLTEYNKQIRMFELADLDADTKLAMIAPLRRQRDFIARSVVEQARMLGAI